MANPLHVAKLAEGVEAWNEWMRTNRKKKRKEIPDISGKTIYGGVYSELRQMSFADPQYAIRRNRNKGINMPDLFQVDLSGVNFEGVNLQNVKFYEPNFTGANLKGAALDGANLYGAKLLNTNLTDASLHKTNLHGAYFKDTLLMNTNFDEAKGLESCNHIGLSPIDLHTLTRSNGLPMVFLRGCGLVDWQIEASKLYTNTLSTRDIYTIAYKIMELKSPDSIQYYSCFISYSHADKEFAKRLHDTLQGKGIRCWLDEHQILPGDDFYEQIKRGISLWDKVLLCCSASSLSSWWVDNEIDTAFGKERAIMTNRGEKVLALIPLNIDGFMFSDTWTNGKKDQIRSRSAADFTGWEKDKNKFDRQVKQVLLALRVGEQSREIPPQSLL